MKLTLKEALKRGLEAQEIGQFQKAEKLYKLILQAQPNHPDANYNMGVLAIGAEKTPEALPFFKLALREKPDTNKFWLGYIDTLIKLEKGPDALAVLAQAKNRGAKGKFLDQLEQRISGLGNNFRDTDFEEKSTPAEPEVREISEQKLQELISLFNQGQLQKVLDETTTVLKKLPESDKLYNIRGAAYQGLGETDQALADYQQALRINPNNIDAHNNIAIVLRKTGDLEAALESCKKALDIQPNNASTHNNTGVTLGELGDHNGAIASYKNALKFSPDNPEVFHNMGTAQKNKGDVNDAIESYEKAIQIKPDYAEAYYGIANVLSNKGDLEAAVETCKKALKIQPDIAGADNLMGWCYYRNKKYEEAKDCFSRIGDNASAAMFLECDYVLGNYKSFNKGLRTMAKTNPRNIRAAALSAFASHQLSQKDIYPFCKNPFEFINFAHIKNYVPDANEFLTNILKEMDMETPEWEPVNYATKSGFQTSGNLFSSPSKSTALLENIIKKEIDLFYLKFNTYRDLLIQDWPRKSNLTGWYVRMLQNGHQDSHIHDSGWVSGVVYLRTIETPVDNEGAIEFGLHGYSYPIKNNDYPRKIHQPSDGEIILFPSSLFHRTIPVNQDTERRVIAFDLVPK